MLMLKQALRQQIGRGKIDRRGKPTAKLVICIFKLHTARWKSTFSVCMIMNLIPCINNAYVCMYVPAALLHNFKSDSGLKREF